MDNKISFKYDKLHMIFGEGNFVLTASEGEIGGVHSSFYDLFRVENGKIVEHWDTIEAIPSKETWKNTNGKFQIYIKKRKAYSKLVRVCFFVFVAPCC